MIIILVILAIIIGFFAKHRAEQLEIHALEKQSVDSSVESKFLSSKERTRLHSRPKYHITFVLFFSFVLPLLTLLATNFGFKTYRNYQVLKLDSQLLVDSNLVILEVENILNKSLNENFASKERKAQAKLYSKYNKKYALYSKLLLAALIAVGFIFSFSKISLAFKARLYCETILRLIFKLAAFLSVLITIGIILSLIFESFRFFNMVNIFDFLFGLHWSPQVAIRSDQVGSSGAFGAVPLFVGTLLISFIAMAVAIPCGLFSAVYLAEYANSSVRKVIKPMLEILAGIPTVVYGFFAALTVAPFINHTAEYLGITASSENALAAGLVMGVMIIPFISSLSDDVINAVPQTLRDASYALGATRSETVKKVILPAALPGIVAACMLAMSRAIGETMIVVMAAGLAANLTLNPLSNVTTVTVQIVTALVGDQEFDSPKTLSVFALGLMLFFVTLSFNILSMYLVKRYKEQYD